MPRLPTELSLDGAQDAGFVPHIALLVFDIGTALPSQIETSDLVIVSTPFLDQRVTDFALAAGEQ